MSVLSVLGSARGDGHTVAVLDAVVAGRNVHRIDLRDINLRHYDYEPIEPDDFPLVVDALTASSTIIFATPVYWYAMSGRLKVLFDRFTELVTRQKDVGRRLAGRRVYVVSCGSDDDPPQGFEVPFQSTAQYLAMTYSGIFYASTANGVTLSPEMSAAAKRFGDTIFENDSNSPVPLAR